MALMEVRHVAKSFRADGKTLQVLEDVSIEVGDRDLVCVVGPSGGGKSTLLRIMVGLEKADRGEVLYQGKPIHPGNPKVAMVFQSFALLPWLTVQQNVELGLEALRVPPDQRRLTATKYIEAVGLDGFENAYPKELSGGMKQRVGFARALALEPVLLCMDEPFSALDALTAQNLRDELLLLWAEPDMPPQAIIMVTHLIEEAVYMGDRVVVLSRRPAKVVKEVRIDLPRPRNRKDPEFYGWVDEIYSHIV